MRNSKLKEEYMKEESFWHVTNKKNLESIREKGMVPKDGKREGVLKSEIDPVPRVFFSHGLEAVLWQANNLAYLIDNFCTEQIKVKEDGYNRKELNKEIKKFLEDKENGKENTKGFIDIGLFLQEKINSKGISKSITEKDLEMVSYNLTKSLWENSIYIKANLEDGIDYSYEKDFNYIRGGKTKPMDNANMHTFEGRSIDSEKLEVMSDDEGKPLNSWEVLKQMAEYYKKENPDKEHLPVRVTSRGYTDENGKTVILEDTPEKDYISIFMGMEKNIEEQEKISKMIKGFAKDKEVCLRTKETEKIFDDLEKDMELEKGKEIEENDSDRY
ncbi:MAG: hypothetical protein HG454_005870 [Clostridiales bacterium]|nr:hypothetical protein [Clostridiales bacterium]